MKGKKKVSVVIPCYNSEEYVSESIESALEQRYEPKEIIVVDDGSTDQSREIVRQYTDSEKVVLVQNEENLGEAKTCNRAIENASGELIKILHADDKLCEGIIRRQVDQAKKSKNNTVIFGDLKFIESGDFHHRDQFRERKEGETWTHYILKNNPHPSSPLHRKELLEKNEGFDPGVPMPDYDFHLRLCLNGVRFKYVPGDVSVIRIHDGPDRVQNQDHFAEDPEGELSRIKDRWNRIDSAEMLTDDVKQHLAQTAWQTGRRALRTGRDRIAERYFEYAREAHPSPIAGGSSAYEWCVQVFGPGPAEQIAAMKRKIVGR